MEEVRKYSINLCKGEYYETDNENARFLISVRKSTDMEIGSHTIRINETDKQEYLHVGNWYFIKRTIFCDNTPAKGLRIEINAKNLSSNDEYIFYGIDSYVENLNELAEYAISLIVEIAQNDTIEEFDSHSLNSKVSRIKYSI